MFFDKINIFTCTNKMHISTILLVISVILSGVAIGLPLWSGAKLDDNSSISSGLWSYCASDNPGENQKVSCQAWSKDNKAPKDLIVSQITAVAGAALALIALALCAMNHKTAVWGHWRKSLSQRVGSCYTGSWKNSFEEARVGGGSLSINTPFGEMPCVQC